MHPKLRPALAALLLTLPAWAGSMASVRLDAPGCFGSPLTDEDSSVAGSAGAEVSGNPICPELPFLIGGVGAAASPGVISLYASVQAPAGYGLSAVMEAQSFWTVFVPGPQVGWFETTLELYGSHPTSGEIWSLSGPGFNFVGDPFPCGDGPCSETLLFISDPIAVPIGGQSFSFSMAGYAAAADGSGIYLNRYTSLNTQFHPMPEPASGALLLIGTIGLLLRRASHKSSKL